MNESNQHYLPTATWTMLQRRAELLRRIRLFFDSRGFVEVETPVLSHDTVVDRHIDPIPVEAHAVSDALPAGPPLFLQTSPEFAMKRLLGAGATKIYQLAHAFRRNESGVHHNIEFTMLEWYEVAIDYGHARVFLGEFLREFFPQREVLESSYREAFQRWLQIDPLSAPLADLQQAAASRGSDPWVSNSSDRDEILNWLLAEVVQSRLGRNVIEIVYDWPASQSALAQVRCDCFGTEVAERFEAYVDGQELANGYHELLDAVELVRRNRINNELREADGGSRLPEDSRLLSAMRSGLPDCSGVALGVDRLLMKVVGANSIDEVIAFPFRRA